MLIELSYEIGLTPIKVASTNGGEYATFCPKCGGKDRFRIWPNKENKNCTGSYWCRKCEISGDSIQFCIDLLGCSFNEATKRVNATISEKRKSFILRKKNNNSFKPITIKPLKDEWIAKANSFVEWTHKEIWNQPEVLKLLNNRGLPKKAIQKYKIGWNQYNIFCDKGDWGLNTIEDENNKLWIPRGLVIPCIEQNGNVVRLKIRRKDWFENDKIGKYIIVPGSMNGLSIIGNTKNKVTVVVESELDAYAICNAADDFIFAISVGGSIKNPDNVSDYLAKRTNITLLICHDNDEAGINMFNKWKNLYPHAIKYPTPKGKDIGEAYEQGVNIEEWLQSVLTRERFKVARPAIKINNCEINSNKEIIKVVSKKVEQLPCDIILTEDLDNNVQESKNKSSSVFIKSGFNESPVLKSLGIFWTKKDSKFVQKVTQGSK